jgi:uncharacterized membrane protein
MNIVLLIDQNSLLIMSVKLVIMIAEKIKSLAQIFLAAIAYHMNDKKPGVRHQLQSAMSPGLIQLVFGQCL